ncbi:MAG TPA: 3-hydroxyacyl-ACP dehydratase FabZ [Thermodesulfovibrionales bacterium]|nr:3-hydroxyacyl-ACP dehydratase FabZ [Thermodesulfovibrionales bacterium]
MMDVREIQDVLPHRYPFLLVDRILEMDMGKRAVGIKNVTINEPFFTGHFPGNPIMPGVLIVEAMAQVAGILAFRSGVHGEAVYFMSIEKAKFRKPVVPGDQLRFEINTLQQRGYVWKFSGGATVEGKLVAEAEFTAMVVINEDSLKAKAPSGDASKEQ